MKQGKEKQNDLGGKETMGLEKVDTGTEMRTYDAACGTGEFLINALEEVKNNAPSK